MQKLMTGLLLLLLTGAAQAERGTPIQLAATPTLSPDGSTLVFEWDGDLWSASSGGGAATPITQHPAPDTFPSFSPDGKSLAFASLRDDTWQAYVMPAEGGPAKQVTFNTEGCTPLDWFPDGKSILIRAARDQPGFNKTRFFRVYVEERRSEQLLFDAYGHDAAISQDGRQILFTREQGHLYRKGYHGSRASQIWLYNLADRTFRLVRKHERGCRSPLWKPDGKGFYYVGGESGSFNVREYDLASGEDRQLTTFTDDSVIIPGLSRDGSTMVFRHLFDFYRLRPGGGKPSRLDLRHETDRPRRKPERRWYDKVWDNSGWGRLAFTDDGLQMAFTTGGDLWVMDTVIREPVAVTTETAFHETEAVFTPGAKKLYFLRDSGDAVNIWEAERADAKRDWWQNHAFKLSSLTDDTHGRYNLSVSPDGRKLVCVRGAGDLYVRDLESGLEEVLASSPFEVHYAWSPDSRWLACVLRDSDDNTDVWLVSVDLTCDPYNLSRAPNWDGAAAWSPDGRTIAYISRSYDQKLSIQYAWLRQKDEAVTQRVRDLEQAVLKAGAPAGDDPNNKGRIDFDGLSDRVHKIDLPDAVPEQLFWSFDSKALAFTGSYESKRGTYRLQWPNPLAPTLITEKTGIHTRWVEKGSQILWLVDGIPHASQAAYPFKAYQRTDWSDYYRLGFLQVWRFMRDYFYDPGLHGCDWQAIRAKYEDMAARTPDDDRFSKLVSLLLGELNASHAHFFPSTEGEWSSQNWRMQTAHLGLGFDTDDAGPGLKVSHVLPGGPSDNADAGPVPGERLLTIDGQDAGPGVDLTRMLNGPWPRDIRLRVANKEGRERTVVVTHEGYPEIRELIDREEIERNRGQVEKGSGGALGYVKIPRMEFDDLRRFEKEVCARGIGKRGLVIDARDNVGGYVSDHLLMILCHPQHAVTVPRGGTDSYPGEYLLYAQWNKPIVVLCNQNTGSNGEIFCHAIKSLKRGKIVGVPTQGAVISAPRRKVLDLGEVTIPERGWYVLEGRQNMELNGVQPDVVVWPEPGEVPAGIDRQLETAVGVLMSEL